MKTNIKKIILSIITLFLILATTIVYFNNRGIISDDLLVMSTKELHKASFDNLGSYIYEGGDRISFVGLNGIIEIDMKNNTFTIKDTPYVPMILIDKKRNGEYTYIGRSDSEVYLIDGDTQVKISNYIEPLSDSFLTSMDFSKDRRYLFISTILDSYVIDIEQDKTVKIELPGIRNGVFDSDDNLILQIPITLVKFDFHTGRILKELDISSEEFSDYFGGRNVCYIKESDLIFLNTFRNATFVLDKDWNIVRKLVFDRGVKDCKKNNFGNIMLAVDEMVLEMEVEKYSLTGDTYVPYDADHINIYGDNVLLVTRRNVILYNVREKKEVYNINLYGDL